MVSWGAEDLTMTQSPARRAELGFAWWLCGYSGSYLQLCLGDGLACSLHLSLKNNLALSFWWQLRLFPALGVSWSAGCGPTSFFAVMCLLLGPLLVALLCFLTCGQFWQLHILPWWWCPYRASHRWSSATGGLVARKTHGAPLHCCCGWKRSWQLQLC